MSPISGRSSRSAVSGGDGAVDRALFAIFGQYRTGSGDSYSAVFRDASSLRSGDSVQVAGVRSAP